MSKPEQASGGAPPLHVVAVLVASLALLAVAVRLAWLGDDAYITLRSVENWCSGNGLRWNPTDRVQTYTHPLWMLLMSAARALSGEIYFTVLSLSLALSMGAVVWLLVRARSAAAIVATAMLLLGARAFGDYMTSGLETPLTFVLLVAFVANQLSGREPAQRYGRAVLLATLLATNRMDLALLCLPPVLASMRRVPWSSLWRRGLLGSLPFFGWLLFAGIYYGSPFPVTAHAKAFGVGIPDGELAEQGLHYMLHTLHHDPVLFVTAVLGSLLLLVPGRSRWLAFGALCYLAYVVKVGGGFMQGRFLLPPFVVVVACLVPWLRRLHGKGAWWFAAVSLAVTFVGGAPAWLRAPASDQPIAAEVIEAQHGIVDERRMYYRELGLLAPTRALPVFGSLEQQAFPGGREERWFLLNGAVGSAGFGAGAEGHVVDPLLCDPLVARLPARDPANWRIGHVLRRIPEGYWESLAFGENRIHHPGLRRYYGALRTLTQAPVFDGERLGTLFEMAVGAYDGDFRAFLLEQYYEPPRIVVEAQSLGNDVALGTFWFDDRRVQLIYEGGVAVRLEQPSKARTLAVRMFGRRAFRFRFVQNGEVFGEAMGVPQPPAKGLTPLRMIAGVRAEVVRVPDAVVQYDTVWIDPVEVPGSDQAIGPPGIARFELGN